LGFTGRSPAKLRFYEHASHTPSVPQAWAVPVAELTADDLAVQSPTLVVFHSPGCGRGPGPEI